MESKKQKKWTTITKQKQGHKENKQVVARGKGVWEKRVVGEGDYKHSVQNK